MLTIRARLSLAADNSAERIHINVYLRESGQQICQFPMFEEGASATENSPIGYGNDVVLENNAGYPGPFGDPLLTTAGLTRVHVREDLSGCELVWHTDTDLSAYDAIVLPGGLPGAEHLRDDALLIDMLREQNAAGRIVAAICAAPMALKAHGVFEGRKLTSHPSVKTMLEDWGAYSEHPVEADGNLITSRGPGTAFPFALRIVGALTDAERMADVRAPMMFPVQVS